MVLKFPTLLFVSKLNSNDQSGTTSTRKCGDWDFKLENIWKSYSS